MSKTSVFKRGLTAFMAMLLCLSSFIGLGTTTAYAAGEQAEVYMISFPRDGDANYGGDWGHPNLHYMNGWTSGSSNKTTIRAMGSYTGIACYCIEPGVTQNTGDVLTKWDENFWDNYPSNLNSTISRPLLAESFSMAIPATSPWTGAARMQVRITFPT